jgi:hypothetical protein
MWTKILCFFFLLTTPLFSDWNDRFDRETEKLFIELPELKMKGRETYEDFYFLRSNLLRDGSLKRQLKNASALEKFVLLRPRQGMVIKKRENNRIHELFVWEVSLLLGSSSCFVPSFPVEIEGKRVIVQQMEPIIFGRVGEKKDGEMPSLRAINSVSLVEYFKAHLQAYLFGVCDLLGRNIGISPEGKIRFFDAEASFRYQNFPCWGGDHVSIGFLAESFDWPQYRKSLDKKTAESLQLFVSNLVEIEKKLELYQKYRGVSIVSPELLHCLEKIRSFSFVEGKSFRDFFGTIYPELNKGLGELTRIVSKIYGTEVDHGAALTFVFRHMSRYPMSTESRIEIRDWVSRYLD